MLDDKGQELLSNLSAKQTGSMQYTKDFHVTLAFLRKQAALRDNCAIIKSGVFQEDKEVEVTIKALVVVPGKIVTAMVDCPVKSENAVAHITMMTGGEWKPVHSNDILKALFAEGYGLLRG